MEKGTTLESEQGEFSLSSSVLEGHRFAVCSIPAGRQLLSWGLPFGTATRLIAPGDYICNTRMLEELQLRRSELSQPQEPNFRDWPLAYEFDRTSFQAAPGLLTPSGADHRFLGYDRGPRRGVGTRNFIVLLSTNALCNSYVRLLARRCSRFDLPGNIDGVVSVSHTEGAAGPLNNLELLLRTLAGFFCHPNIGAVLCVDSGARGIDNRTLLSFLEREDYPFEEVPSSFLSLKEGWEKSLETGENVVKGWLQSQNSARRAPVPLSCLRLALQCGGSDAFSGISANPLVAWLAREVVRSGGAVNLAETDELIGAEAYLLSRVRDEETALRFLSTLNRFKEWAHRHGHTAEGNPSGGNRLRGLYNITLKSLGAAMKRHPEVALDRVIEYSERMEGSGLHFMDSPGNDLESVAGQVASGCNMITFTTGNGSVTNFPFVPTLKVVTTSARYRLLSDEMDINAGELLEGRAMEDLGARSLDLVLRVASGERTRGEAAGHSQVSIWRDWQLSARDEPAQIADPVRRLEYTVSPPAGSWPFRLKTSGWDGHYATDRVGLIVPASLCAAEISRRVADNLTETLASDDGLRRFVALPHTEGCGVSAGESQQLALRTLLGYLNHPLVAAAFLLEHGCETLHNDNFRREMEEPEARPRHVGFGSIQLDGGMHMVERKVEDWFGRLIGQLGPPSYRDTGLEALSLGLCSSVVLEQRLAEAVGEAVKAVVRAGGQVFLASDDGFCSSRFFYRSLGLKVQPAPNLHYGESCRGRGLFVMDMPSRQWVEQLSGLGAAGVGIFLLLSGDDPLPGHPLVPSIQVTGAGCGSDRDWADLILQGDVETWPERILKMITEVASGRIVPRLWQKGANDFQLTRGYRGISM